MAVSRADILDQNFTEGLSTLQDRPPSDPGVPWSVGSRLTGRAAIEIFESMVTSRHLDLASRKLKVTGDSFYTIGSAGHEGNAAVAAALRPTDMAFLHYRSGGFFVQRARQVPGSTPIMDVLLGICASTDEPIAGGRHKVFGSVPLCIPPQTSTIASHLPKAMGAAFSLDRRTRLGLETPVPADSIVACSFGDASANHSTACGAFNAAALAAYQNLPCPVLFICEDNNVGISVRTPGQWIRDRFQNHVGLTYFGADGLDIADTYNVASAAQAWVRNNRRPALLHLSLVRLMGHAGSDVEQAYRSLSEIEALESKDPVLGTARRLIAAGLLTATDALDIYEEIRGRTWRVANEARSRPKAETAEYITAPLAPRDSEAITVEAQRVPALLPTTPGGRPRHMAMLINLALREMLDKYPDASIFGEDVAKKGGVYHVTANLEDNAGRGRVFNTPLDEQTILGLAIGAGHMGSLPIPEIQYLAYLHNAIDQIRGEAATLQFFSQDQYRNPMVVRIASLAYQKGFGGHFHNDNAIGALRDIPGLIIACPSNGRDAVGMLRTCMAAATVSGSVVTFLEPIALYMTKDLHEEKDGAWSFAYPEAGFSVPIGRAQTWHDGKDLTLVTYGNGTWMGLRVAKRLEAEGIGCRLVDLRWLAPLPEGDILREVAATGRCLIVDECRRTGGMAEPIMALLAERNTGATVTRVTGLDSFIPLGAAANLVLVQEADIEAAARQAVQS